MVLKYYPSKDATIYERYPTKNTGLDAMLEISKEIIESASISYKYNSRILLDFDYASISRSIVEMGYNPNLFDFRLKLYLATAEEIPTDYSIYCYPISQSWNMGTGKASNSPITTEGVSWTYRTSLSVTSSAWATASFNTNVTASWQTTPGGGTWFTSSAASQSFAYSVADLNLDVNDIIRKVQSGSIAFNGFLLKKEDKDEASALTFKSLRFFSVDTNTVFLPTLEARYDESAYTGSLPFIDTNNEYNIVSTNLQTQYNELSAPIIRFASRPRYPSYVYSTSSLYLTRQILSGSQYAIYSAQSDNVIIEFSNYTKLSHDESGNYFKLHMDSLQPERFYKIVLRIPNSGSYGHQIVDQNWVFKVTRSI